MIGIKTWLYNLSKTKIYIPKTLTSEVYDSVGGTSLDQIIEKNNNNISDAYSDKKTYAVGDYCIYNNSLYKCITEITTVESFNPAKWKLTSISDILGNTDISSIGDGTVTGAVNTLNDRLDCGRTMVTFTITNQWFVKAHVDFNHAFTSPPTVIVNDDVNSWSSDFGDLRPAFVTTTGFDIVVQTQTECNRVVMWMAMLV